MRVMLMIRGEPELSARPSDELLAAMKPYNDGLAKAGVLRDLAELDHRGRQAPQVLERRTHGGGPSVRQKNAVAGYWTLEVFVDGRGRRMGGARAVRGACPNLPG